jgi:hypothetical protein
MSHRIAALTSEDEMPSDSPPPLRRTPHVPEYDPDLIVRLEGHHVAIVNMIDGITLQAECGRYLALRTNLEVLRRIVREHAFEEEFRLYPYLFHRYRGRRPILRELGRLRATHVTIEANLGALVKRYARTDVDESNVEPFLLAFGELEQQIRTRFRREESVVHPLYHG